VVVEVGGQRSVVGRGEEEGFGIENLGDAAVCRSRRELRWQQEYREAVRCGDPAQRFEQAKTKTR
jgi:hypothetical protein